MVFLLTLCSRTSLTYISCNASHLQIDYDLQPLPTCLQLVLFHSRLQVFHIVHIIVQEFKPYISIDYLFDLPALGPDLPRVETALPKLRYSPKLTPHLPSATHSGLLKLPFLYSTASSSFLNSRSLPQSTSLIPRLLAASTFRRRTSTRVITHFNVWLLLSQHPCCLEITSSHQHTFWDLSCGLGLLLPFSFDYPIHSA